MTDLQKAKDLYTTKDGKVNGLITHSYLVKNGREWAHNIMIATTEFASDLPYNKRVWLFINGYTSFPKCPTCNGDILLPKGPNKFNEHCSIKCAQLSPSVQGKIKATSIDRYGVDNIFKCDTFKQNLKQQMMHTYGVDNVSKSEVIKQKISDVFHSKTDEEKQQRMTKISETCMERYGAKSPLESDEIKTKIKESMIEKYGVERAFQHPELFERFKSTMVERYGTDNFNRLYISELNNKEELTELTDKYNMSHIATLLGVSKSTVGIKVKQHNIDYEKKYSSTLEYSLLDYIRTIYEGEIKVCDTTIIPPYELDVYIPPLKLAIECNGITWHSENFGKKTKNYHLIKTKLCRDKGIRLIHVMEDKWYNNTDIMKSIIKHALNVDDHRIYARMCVIVNVDNKSERDFLEKNHLKGYITGSSHKIGLEYNGELVCLMTVCKPRYNKDYDYEILRSCTKLGHNIIGGFSKMLSFFKNAHCTKGQTIISYCDSSVYSGKSYESVGFTHNGFTPPSYRYFKGNWRYMMGDRTKFQKHKLKGLLSIYDPKLSEWENMLNNGYDRIWDCGTSRWVMIV